MALIKHNKAVCPGTNSFIFSWRLELRKICDKYDEAFHLMIGSLIGCIGFYLLRISFWNALLSGLVGAIFPDVDHLLSAFLFNRKAPYCQKIRIHLKRLQIRAFIRHTSQEHKKFTGNYLHNMCSMVVCLLLSFYLLNSSLKIFFFSCFCHFVWDIIGDLIVLGKLNSNWFLKFD